MRFTSRIPATAIVSALLLAGLFSAPGFSQDKAKAAPAAAPAKAKEASANSTTVLENEKVKVMEVRYKPGEGGAARERPPRVVRAIAGGTMQRTYPDGKTENVEWKTGETKWFKKDSFANKNVGKTEVVLYVVEVK